MRRLLVLAFAAGCASPPQAPSSDALIRSLMGSNDRLKLEIQLLTAPPVDEAAIRERVHRIAQNVAKMPAMDEERPRAVEMLRELAAARWTAETAAERWNRLEESCAVCHAKIKPKTAAAPVDLKKWTALPSWDACGRCHQSVFAEWRETLHAGAWLDPVYRMSAGNPPKLECRSCHSMEPILAGEIDVAYEWRPIFRDYNHDDGVGCVSCHLRADGSVAARRTVDAPCRPVKDERISTPEFCGACHNPSHDAYNEWKQTRYAKEGVDCNACHSFPVVRTTPSGKRVGFSHSFPGGNDGGFVRRALHHETKLDGRAVVAVLENRCGHKFPGEVPSRALIVRTETWDADGQALEPLETVLKRPFKSQTGLPDNRLVGDERREFRVPLPEKAAYVRVSYLFRPSPLMMERGWHRLGTWESKVER